MAGGGAISENSEIVSLLNGTVFEVAEALLGCTISTRLDGELTSVQLEEVEAYAGPDDPASHAFRGETPRNAPMYGPPGTLYVYRSYGIHWCMNIMVGPEGMPHAVLLRGGAPLDGATVMRRRRGRSDHLSDGPGKLCQALGVTGDDGGTSVLDGPVRLTRGTRQAAIVQTPRIGISVAKNRPWRYILEAQGN